MGREGAPRPALPLSSSLLSLTGDRRPRRKLLADLGQLLVHAGLLLLRVGAGPDVGDEDLWWSGERGRGEREGARARWRARVQKEKGVCVWGGGGGPAASGGLEAHASAQPILSSPRRAWPRAAGAPRPAGRGQGKPAPLFFYRGLSPPHWLPCTRAPGPATTPHPMSASYLQAAHGLQLRHGVGWHRREGRPLDGENKKGGGQQKKRGARAGGRARDGCVGESIKTCLLFNTHSRRPGETAHTRSMHTHT